MGNIVYFFSIFIGFVVAVVLILVFSEKWTQPKSSYEKFLKEELERNPDYINWLKCYSKKDYKLGLSILAKVERDRNNSYKKWFKKMRKLGKW